MTPRSTVPILRLILSVLTIVALAVPGSAAPIRAIPGEDIPLGGTATGVDVVYLFLTGPNLPDPGISLTGGTPVSTGVPSSFTRVEINTDGTWRFTWQTGSIGRTLDPGTYTVYAALEPVSRQDLAGADYTEQAVILGPPVGTVTVTVTVPAATGSPVVSTTTILPTVTLTTPSPVESTPLVTAPAPGRLGPGALIPFGASALAILAFRRRR